MQLKRAVDSRITSATSEAKATTTIIHMARQEVLQCPVTLPALRGLLGTGSAHDLARAGQLKDLMQALADMQGRAIAVTLLGEGEDTLLGDGPGLAEPPVSIIAAQWVDGETVLERMEVNGTSPPTLAATAAGTDVPLTSLPSAPADAASKWQWG